VSGIDALIGTTGEVRVRIVHVKVWFTGEYWNAESEDLEVGQKIQVVSVKDLVVCKAAV
jgi:membrane protein implicated in regulation of membrane protease activity